MKIRFERIVWALLAGCLLSVTADAQLLKKNDYGVGVTVAVQ